MSATALDILRADVIVTGRYTDACRAIGDANLATILVALQGLAEAKEQAVCAGKPYYGYIGLLKLAEGRRRRLQFTAQQRAQQGNTPATFRL